MTGGSLQVAVGVKVVGIGVRPGTAPNNTIQPPPIVVTGGATQSLAFGARTSRIDSPCVGEFVVNAGSSLTLDLYAGDLPDVNGQPVALRLVKSIVVVIISGGDASGLRIGGAASNEWIGYFAAAGNKKDIFPGGPPFADGSPAGVAVTSTARNFKIENLGAVNAQVRVYAGGNVVAGGVPIGLLLGLTYP